MPFLTAHAACRICRAADLVSVIHLGEHALSGQFPAAGEPDPPRAPLHVMRCRSCGLVQLEHSVDPEAMFRRYGYRSSVTQTMRDHLAGLAEEAAAMLAGRDGPAAAAPRVLDIGGNDGWTLHRFPTPTPSTNLVLVDPSDVPVGYPGITKVHGFFPADVLLSKKFDLVVSAACYYDSNDPVGWARAVKRVLAPDGLWVVEVADKSAVLRNVAFDFWCHEHVFLPSAADLNEVAKRSDLKVVRAEENLCNGGSVRYYLTHLTSTAYQGRPEWAARVGALWSHGFALAQDGDACDRFAARARALADALRLAVEAAVADGRSVHLLGASTKAGTVLQFAGLDRRLVALAADRDPRKVGRRMPGTGIPVVSEDFARLPPADGPDPLWLTTLPFRDEILARERAAGTRGDLLFFPSLDRVPL